MPAEQPSKDAYDRRKDEVANAAVFRAHDAALARLEADIQRTLADALSGRAGVRPAEMEDSLTRTVGEVDDAATGLLTVNALSRVALLRRNPNTPPQPGGIAKKALRIGWDVMRKTVTDNVFYVVVAPWQRLKEVASKRSIDVPLERTLLDAQDWNAQVRRYLEDELQQRVIDLEHEQADAKAELTILTERRKLIDANYAQTNREIESYLSQNPTDPVEADRMTRQAEADWRAERVDIDEEILMNGRRQSFAADALKKVQEAGQAVTSQFHIETFHRNADMLRALRKTLEDAQTEALRRVDEKHSTYRNLRAITGHWQVATSVAGNRGTPSGLGAPPPVPAKTKRYKEKYDKDKAETTLRYARSFDLLNALEAEYFAPNDVKNPKVSMRTGARLGQYTGADRRPVTDLRPDMADPAANALLERNLLADAAASRTILAQLRAGTFNRDFFIRSRMPAALGVRDYDFLLDFHTGLIAEATKAIQFDRGLLTQVARTSDTEETMVVRLAYEATTRMKLPERTKDIRGLTIDRLPAGVLIAIAEYVKGSDIFRQESEKTVAGDVKYRPAPPSAPDLHGSMEYVRKEQLRSDMQRYSTLFEEEAKIIAPEEKSGRAITSKAGPLHVHLPAVEALTEEHAELSEELFKLDQKLKGLSQLSYNVRKRMPGAVAAYDAAVAAAAAQWTSIATRRSAWQTAWETLATTVSVERKPETVRKKVKVTKDIQDVETRLVGRLAPTTPPAPAAVAGEIDALARVVVMTNVKNVQTPAALEEFLEKLDTLRNVGLKTTFNAHFAALKALENVLNFLYTLDIDDVTTLKEEVIDRRLQLIQEDLNADPDLAKLLHIEDHERVILQNSIKTVQTNLGAVMNRLRKNANF